MHPGCSCIRTIYELSSKVIFLFEYRVFWFILFCISGYYVRLQLTINFFCFSMIHISAGSGRTHQQCRRSSRKWTTVNHKTTLNLPHLHSEMCALRGFRLFLFLSVLFPTQKLFVAPYDIRLKDDTPNGTQLPITFLPELPSERKIYSLLQTRGSQYFTLNSRTGQLSSARFIDRDRLCAESGLCCPGSSISTVMDTTNHGFTYPSSIHAMQTCPGQRFGSALLAQACVFNLSVSVVSTTGQQPDIFPITITICEENDHVPQFKVSSKHQLWEIVEEGEWDKKLIVTNCFQI